MSTTVGYDATTGNVGTMPAGMHAGYITGTSNICWTAQQWVADPSAIRIDQSPVNTALDETADVLDFENGAATAADIVPWVNAARANYAAGVRPGQRKPMIYCNRSDLTVVANTLSAAKMSVPIWLADPGIPLSAAQAMINTASGPFPIYGVQYAFGNTYDDDVFLASWLAAVSGTAGNTVSPGSYGPAVIALQERINVWAAAAHLPSLVVDGAFGVSTLAAVIGFQGFKKLTQDGVVGPATWKALNSSPQPSPPPDPYVFAAPAGFKTNNLWLNLVWDPVAPVNGHTPTGYTVGVYQPDGTTLIGTKTFAGPFGQVLLAVGHSYQIHVWADGGTSAPPHASLNVTV